MMVLVSEDKGQQRHNQFTKSYTVQERTYYMLRHALTFQFLRQVKQRIIVAHSSAHKKRQQRSLANSCERI
jgi:hypothetical protein